MYDHIRDAWPYWRRTLAANQTRHLIALTCDHGPGCVGAIVIGRERRRHTPRLIRISPPSSAPAPASRENRRGSFLNRSRCTVPHPTPLPCPSAGRANTRIEWTFGWTDSPRTGTRGTRSGSWRTCSGTARHRRVVSFSLRLCFLRKRRPGRAACLNARNGGPLTRSSFALRRAACPHPQGWRTGRIRATSAAWCASNGERTSRSQRGKTPAGPSAGTSERCYPLSQLRRFPER